MNCAGIVSSSSDRCGRFRATRLLAFALTFTCFLVGKTAGAQSPGDRASSSWKRVQQLAPSTHLKVSADRHGGDCVLQTVSADSLVCLQGHSMRVLPRAEIKWIKLARRGRSTAAGLGIGAAVGVGAGIISGAAINSSDQGNLLHVSAGKALGVGAAIGVILGATAGAVIGYTTNLSPGSVIYKR